MLPDNVLLEIFDFYQELSKPHLPRMEMALTRACMSKMATNRICVTTPSRSPNSSAQAELLSGRIWASGQPSYRYQLYLPGEALGQEDEDNVIAALEHLDRVCHVRLY
jgi:hypothetical protein